MEKKKIELEKMKPCPKCGREIDIEKNLYGGYENWVPTYYDPDSGGDPYEIRCECGIRFCSGDHEIDDFIKAWNDRV